MGEWEVEDEQCHEGNLRPNARCRTPFFNSTRREHSRVTWWLYSRVDAPTTTRYPTTSPIGPGGSAVALTTRSTRARHGPRMPRQCGRSNDLNDHLLTRSNELPLILDSTITIAHIRSQSTHRNDRVHAHAAVLGAPRAHTHCTTHTTHDARAHARRAHTSQPRTHMCWVYS